MSYTPHEWQNDELITAAKLNNIEEGIAEGGGGAVIITDNGTQLDKTYAEIYNLVNSGTPCYILYDLGKSVSDLDSDYSYWVKLMRVTTLYKYSDTYRVFASSSAVSELSGVSYLARPSIWIYDASNSDSYPTFLRVASVNPASMTLHNYRAE